MKFFGVSGSPRKNGNSDILLKTIIAGVTSENTPSIHLNLTDMQFQGCIGCERCRKDKICTGLADGMSLMYPHMVSSKGLILVSPTHNYNITSWMKAFIDRHRAVVRNNCPGWRRILVRIQGAMERAYRDI
jgi:multimeric flavodoxin WrbA